MLNMSMDKRSEVDKRVAQEIKNHYDFIKNINKEVQRLKDEIPLIKSEMLKQQGFYESSLKDLSIECEIHREKLDMLHHQLKQEVSLCLMSTRDASEYIRRYIESSKNQFIKSEDLENCMANFNKMFSEVCLRIERSYSTFESERNAIKNYVDSKFNLLSEKIDDAPKEFQVHVDKIDNILSENAVNISGFRDEITKFKKEQFVNARNIEALIQLNREKICHKKA